MAVEDLAGLDAIELAGDVVGERVGAPSKTTRPWAMPTSRSQ